MELYNSLLAEQKIDQPKDPIKFTPLNGKSVRIYSCGPTVYDHAHIGNMAAYIFADTLRRVTQMAFPNHTIEHAMNYTDIDDKTIRRSRELYTDLNPREALTKLTDTYIDLFLRDMQSVGNDINAMHFMRATDNITQMQQLIVKLLKGNFAYIAEDGIYFSIEAYKNASYKYGQLSQIDANTTSEARIANDEYDKDEAHDFALWKKQKDGEPAWDFTVEGINMTGRPGWHIECSAMSENALGLPFDIHTGGIDLKFPHHENEIAQSTALANDDRRMAQFFCHNNHILVDGHKMAKSANNFYTLDDIIAKGYDPLAFRLLVLQSHYRNQINFTWESLDAAQNRLNTLRAFADLRHQPISPDDYEMLDLDYAEYAKIIKNALKNDVATPKVMKIIAEIVDQRTNPILNDEIGDFKQLLKQLDDTLGLRLLESEDINGNQKQIITERQQARNDKNWQLSDDLRSELEKQRIGLRDTKYGAVWYRI